MHPQMLDPEREIEYWRMLEPLVRIGAAVRLRHLEQAREAIMHIHLEAVDRDIIDRGKIAAHRANGAADSVLFQLGLVPKDHLAVATRTFERLYKCPSLQYELDYPWRRLLDCDATLLMLNPTVVSGSIGDLYVQYNIIW